MAAIISVNISEKKGVKKKEVERGFLKKDHGIVGDAHAGNWHRQVSLLAKESIDRMRDMGLELDSGAFAENIVTDGLILHTLPVGTKIRMGKTAVGEVTQIGKECHSGCAIAVQTGECIMPREGIFVRVLEEGEIRAGDSIEVLT